VFAGFLGCGDDCLNRMLCIECIDDHCPAGGKSLLNPNKDSVCTNQQFQRKQYATLQKVTQS
jgi:histone-lysine N-methyltransferase SETD2